MKPIIILLFGVLQISLNAQHSKDFRKVPVNKQVKEFDAKFDLSSPLQTHLTIQFYSIKSMPDFWPQVNVARNRWDNPVYEFSDDQKQRILNATILEVNYYKDSVAAVISKINDSVFNRRCYELEGVKWYHAGEDYFNSYESAYEQFLTLADMIHKNVRQENRFAAIPKDTLAFVNYVKSEAKDPHDMVLQSLASYKLVAYGEIHRRLLSWDFCRRLVNDPRFAKTTGTVFMEISAHSQDHINEFLASSKLNKELILETFRDMNDNGWNDKGMFDFITDIWKVNQKLPDEKKIKIIAVDIPRPWNFIMSREDIDKVFNRVERDSFMAKTISEYLVKKKDPRNAFFVVGSGHLCKTTSSAGAILANNLPKNEYYSYFTHCPRISNNGFIPGKIRHGVFDYVFLKSGNKPMAFSLSGSPFGKEPFDGLVGLGTGTYADNYDGYIFLGPLDDEPNGQTLFELYNESFIKELDRRARIFGSSLMEAWHLKDDSKESIITSLNENKSQFRWGKIPN